MSQLPDPSLIAAQPDQQPAPAITFSKQKPRRVYPIEPADIEISADELEALQEQVDKDNEENAKLIADISGLIDYFETAIDKLATSINAGVYSGERFAIMQNQLNNLLTTLAELRASIPSEDADADPDLRMKSEAITDIITDEPVYDTDFDPELMNGTDNDSVSLSSEDDEEEDNQINTEAMQVSADTSAPPPTELSVSAVAKPKNVVKTKPAAKPKAAAKKKPAVKPSTIRTAAVTSTANNTSSENEAEPAQNTINFAPNPEPVRGNPTVCVINLIWADYPGKPKSSVQSAANYLASRYNYLSHGMLVHKPTVYNVKVNYKHEPRYIGSATNAAKGKLPKADRYVVITSGIGVSHAGGNTAQILGTLARDWCHEMGHVLYNQGKPARVLGHSGRYVFIRGKEVLQAYYDGISFMSSYASNGLAPSQLYYLGWAGVNKTAQYSYSDGVQDFTLVPGFLYYKDPSKQPADTLTGVYIPNDNNFNGKFVAPVVYEKQNTLVLWLGDMHGGTSQRKGTTRKSMSPRNWNLKIDVVSIEGPKMVVRFTPLNQKATLAQLAEKSGFSDTLSSETSTVVKLSHNNV